MDRYEIQTKVSGKWIEHGIVEGDEAAARRAWLYVSGTLAAASRLITHDDKGRVIVVAKRAARSGYRVTYGETLPVRSRVLPTLDAAEAFANKQRNVGDIVFGIEAVTP